MAFKEIFHIFESVRHKNLGNERQIRKKEREEELVRQNQTQSPLSAHTPLVVGTMT